MSESKLIKRKKIVILTDYVLSKSGFGKHARYLFEYLYKLNKYDLVNIAVGSVDTQIAGDAQRTPWKTIASVNAAHVENLKRQNPPNTWGDIERMAGYGAFAVDEIVKSEKPDIFIGIQDIWGVDFCREKSWFDKIPCVLWTTLDSLPILPKAVELAPKVKNYWSWADFATKALHKMGHKHIKTVRGTIDTKDFYRLSDEKRKLLRQKNNIPDNAFVIGFVFRNQLRKSVPNLIQGYKIFKQENPKQTTRLLLHTCWVEGWNISSLLEEHGIDKSEVLTTYICKNCRQYQVKPFVNNDQDCPYCKAQKSQCTTHPSIGVTEKGLNEVYNMMDVYCHPFTSGGQEIPIQEAKLTELITLVTNYSCGEDSCVEGAGSLPLDWSEYREPGTQFIKASTFPSSISKQLTKVLNMNERARRDLGKVGRKWVIDNFSVEVIGKFVENWVDSQPPNNYDFVESSPPKDPNVIVPSHPNDEEWVKSLYKQILKMDVSPTDDGLKHWMGQIHQGMPKPEIENFFRKVASQENQKNQKVSFEDLLDKNDKERILFVVKESAGDIFLCTSLFKSIKKRYPEMSLYVATKSEYQDIIHGNPHVKKWIEYNPMMDNLIWAEGNNQHNGFFQICYLPTVGSQSVLNYMHNSKDSLDFDLKYKD